MPINKATGYVDSSGAMHASIEEAQLAELKHTLGDFASVSEDEAMREEIAIFIQRRADAILAILTTGPRSRPRTRRAAATSNPRRAARRAATADSGLTAQLAEQHG